MNLITKLSEYKAAKLVRCQKHPSLDLYIWNYSDLTQCKQHWDDITRMARGLVTNGNGDIIARSFKKFHNIEEGHHTPTADFVVEEKMDGSLIIAFWYEDQWIVASRGSFVSAQAVHARALLEPRFASMDKGLTYSLEVIYPENRIVVDYGARDEVILLTAFDRDGNEHSEAMIPGVSKVATFHFTEYATIKKLDWANSEGFVVRFSNGERVKIKFQNYLDMHRIVTNINGQTVWDLFCKNPEKLDFNDDGIEIPDEFMRWVEHKWNDMKATFDELTNTVNSAYQQYTRVSTTRAEFAKLASKHKFAKVLFALYDNRSEQARQIILDMTRPKDGHLDTPFSGSTGAVATKQNTLTTPRTITVLIGPSGAGKTTWCQEYLRHNPQTVRVSRDAIRAQLYTEPASEYYAKNDITLHAREDMVSTILLATIEAAINRSADVVVDNTHLEKRYIEKYIKAFPYCRFVFKTFATSLEKCIANDAKRPQDDRVGKERIEKQYIKFKTMLKSRYVATKTCIDPHDIRPLATVPNKPQGYVFDVDGTLADNSHRSPYNWNAVDKDSVIESVRNVLVALKSAGYMITICTGRDGSAETKTRAWLVQHNIPYDMFYIRPAGNKEPDWIVKERMWRDIATKMNIVAMFDDRDCVVRHGRKLGLCVYQVADGAF